MRAKSGLAWFLGTALFTVIGTASGAETPAAAAASADDPFIWLEQVDSARAMDWVRAENAKTAAVLEQDPRYPALYRQALAIAQAQDRIPRPSIIGGQIYNFWQDATHAHGLWRRTTLAEFRRPQGRWTPVLDLDALSRSENGNWFWGGAQCAQPAERRCMISLSDGGEDAVTVREFDLPSGKFVAAGFRLPSGKQTLAWQDPDTLLVSREWAPGELTKSGYAYIVKRVKRGQPLAAAQEIYRGTPDDVGVDPVVLHDGAGHQALVVQRNVTFFETEYRLLTDQGLARLGLPLKSGLLALVSGRLVIELRDDSSRRNRSSAGVPADGAGARGRP
jgi:prolyl oligopeptidase